MTLSRQRTRMRKGAERWGRFEFQLILEPMGWDRQSSVWVGLAMYVRNAKQNAICQLIEFVSSTQPSSSFFKTISIERKFCTKLGFTKSRNFDDFFMYNAIQLYNNFPH